MKNGGWAQERSVDPVIARDRLIGKPRISPLISMGDTDLEMGSSGITFCNAFRILVEGRGGTPDRAIGKNERG